MRRFGFALCLLLLTVGCAQSNTQTVTVFAASSLQDAFRQLGSDFMDLHPRYKVVFSFDSSSRLSHQIIDGAPADIFASADSESMDLLVLNDEIVGASAVFTTNHLRILVARSAVDRIHSLVDLSRRDVVVVLATADVPLGRYSAAALVSAGVMVTPQSFETSASGVVAKIVNGEADAGIVYSSDVVGVGNNAVGVEIPAAINADIFYPIALTRHGSQNLGAAQWIKFVISKRGQEVLREHGFSSTGDK